MGYRIDWRGRSCARPSTRNRSGNLFITDPENPDYDEMMALEGEKAAQEANRRMRSFFRGADLLIYDGQYTDQEYRSGRSGWGHSSVGQAIAAAESSGCRRLALVHHDPLRTDAELDDLTRQYAGVRLESGLHVCFAPRRARDRPLIGFF